MTTEIKKQETKVPREELLWVMDPKFLEKHGISTKQEYRGSLRVFSISFSDSDQPALEMYFENQPPYPYLRINSEFFATSDNKHRNIKQKTYALMIVAHNTRQTPLVQMGSGLRSIPDRELIDNFLAELYGFTRGYSFTAQELRTQYLSQ